jgi:hypothetical protein
LCPNILICSTAISFRSWLIILLFLLCLLRLFWRLLDFFLCFRLFYLYCLLLLLFFQLSFKLIFFIFLLFLFSLFLDFLFFLLLFFLFDFLFSLKFLKVSFTSIDNDLFCLFLIEEKVCVSS